jgi:hypothetical protein
LSNENYLKEPMSSKWDFTANSAILSFVATAFGITLGVVAFNSYESYISYYSYYGYATPEAVGFWIIAGLAIATGAIGILSGVFALVKKRFALTLIGPVLMLVSGISTFAVEYAYKLSYSDGITIPSVMMIVLSVIALPLLFKSKAAYVDYNAAPAVAEDSELPPETPAEPEVTEQPASQ